MHTDLMYLLYRQDSDSNLIARARTTYLLWDWKWKQPLIRGRFDVTRSEPFIQRQSGGIRELIVQCWWPVGFFPGDASVPGPAESSARGGGLTVFDGLRDLRAADGADSWAGPTLSGSREPSDRRPSAPAQWQMMWVGAVAGFFVRPRLDGAEYDSRNDSVVPRVDKDASVTQLVGFRVAYQALRHSEFSYGWMRLSPCSNLVRCTQRS